MVQKVLTYVEPCIYTLGFDGTGMETNIQQAGKLRFLLQVKVSS